MRHFPATRHFDARENYRDWVAEFDAVTYLSTLELETSDLKDMALFLLTHAARTDPFGDWLDVVAAGTPTKWDRLRGDGRISIELRVAAELLLRFYEDLVAAAHAEPLEKSAQGFRGPFDGRVGRRNQTGSLDALLSPFGLSPHPRLVLVCEGETERRLLRRLIPLLGMRLEDEFIRLVDREGVTPNIDALVRFVATPRVELGDRRDYVTLTRPTTRILVVMDPHGSLVSEEGRQGEKDSWIDRIHTALAREYGVPVPRSEVEHLVEVAVWPSGESFEFAHFTDLELAHAISVVGSVHDVHPWRTCRRESRSTARSERTSRRWFLAPARRISQTSCGQRSGGESCARRSAERIIESQSSKCSSARVRSFSSFRLARLHSPSVSP